MPREEGGHGWNCWVKESVVDGKFSLWAQQVSCSFPLYRHGTCTLAYVIVGLSPALSLPLLTLLRSVYKVGYQP